MADSPGARICVSNAQASDLVIWLEPWLDEILLAPRAALALFVEEMGEHGLPDLEFTDDCLVVYGAGGSRLRVEVNGAEQDTFSRMMPAPPSIPGIGAKGTIETMFGAYPEARPSGVRPTQELRPRFLTRLFSNWRRSNPR